ncbi:MAG: NAD-dependent epimerase/dehydratase family protein [Flavobacteriaceae bacterium]|nr:NAD-dependent epimerase/dehydratase family protein [Bacteroidia bacterium]NNK87892.1 NAD-dependent epimerase/dehydratase family protein [Flavobacteriaceae bacterium]
MIHSEKDNIIIIGGRSRLALALIKLFSEDYSLSVPERETYASWSGESDLKEIKAFFSKYNLDRSIVVISSGVLNSKAAEDEITAVNFSLPKNIMEALKGSGALIITCGTIMENLKETSNPYVRSKIALSNYLKGIDQNEQPWMHLRLHTLYGFKEPSPFMFLGLIYDSLKTQSVFEMSSGLQYREYHHFDDVAQSLKALIDRNQSGIQEITAGNGIRLRDLALGIYKYFQQEDLLAIGAVEIEHQEKFTNDYIRNPHLKDVAFKEPIKGVNNYLDALLKKKGNVLEQTKHN